MRRRDKAGGKAARRPFKASKRRSGLKALNRNETLEQLAATSEVLEAISRSTFDLQTVLATLVKSAGRLCQAENVQIFLHDGEFYRLAADNGFSPEYQQYARDHPIRPGRGTLVARTALGVEPVQIPDALADPEYTYGGRKLGGYRTLLGVPLLRDKNCIGVIALTRSKVQPFTDNQIALVTNFATQAVIAIENTRLLNELRRRTDDLSESLEQQTATSEVLKVISSSASDLRPVFDTMAENAVRLCGAERAYIFRFDGEFLRAVATYNVGPENREFVNRNPIAPGRHSVSARAALERRTVQIPDVQADPEYAYVIRDVEPIRTVLSVPMLKGDELIGTITIYRLEVKPFTDKQVALVETFADQAVIAIENTRLLNELRESLQQQTATADVLKVISSSPGELEPVFQAMLENAVRICGANFGMLFRTEDGAMRAGAMFGVPPAFAEFWQRGPQRPGPRTAFGRVNKTKQTIHIADVKAEPAYVDGEPVFVAAVNLGNFRTMLNVPMLKENDLIGIFAIYRQEVRPFTDKQIALVQNFANQAVIAIENTRLLSELRQRTDDLSEALEQQTATSEVLKVISSSSGELQPVFEAILENATRLCAAKFGNLYLCEGDAFRTIAMHNVPPAFAEARRRHPSVRPEPGTALGRLRSSKRVVHIPDVTADQGYIERQPLFITAVELGGFRAMLAVPMLKDGDLVGAIIIYRQETGAFSEKQIELVTNFAAQAVIAIENTRLLNDLRQRTDDLTESLEQQTATSEVLKVISSSPGELEPVFNAILENATRICDAKFGVLWRRFDDGTAQIFSSLGIPSAFADFLQRGPHRPGPLSPLNRVAKMRQRLHIADYRADQCYLDHDPLAVAGVELGGMRTLLVVPMLNEDKLVGMIGVYRQEVRPFTDKQIELVENFAAQAVIAIENTRLLNELRQRTDDLSESLEQQTATSEVLQVISRSAGELQPVFDTMLENAVRICGAKFGMLYLSEDDSRFRTVAMHDVPRAFSDTRGRNPVVTPPAGSPLGRVVRTRQVAHIADIRTESGYAESRPLRDVADLGGARTLVAVPMLKDNELVGAIVIYRQEIRPFTDKQIELVKNFAAQAVIAIENTRLLSELRESLQRQTATADVLKVISRSTFDLRTVLQTLVESAGRLCDADKALITREKNGAFYRTEAYGFSPEFMEYIKDVPIEADRGSAAGRALLDGRAVHIPDVLADSEYTIQEARSLGDFRTVLAVPMLREHAPIGVLILTRFEVRPFTDKQIELVATFADQAAIAIENVRLFQSVQTRTRELAQSLEDLRTTQDRLVQTQKLASLGQLTAGIAHEIKNPLNFVNNFSVVSSELIDELQDTLKRIPFDDKTRAEINELADTLRGNLDKVVQHGKRADAIVKNMLLHSREGSGEHRPVDINALVEESLNLAYHGARAEKQGFNITLERSLDPTAGEADVFPQDITRALLNLIANGFYAAIKRKTEVNGGDYEPTLAATTKNLGDRVEIRIRDNGTGIPPEVKEKIFNPFFTTKPTGEGTGLGLSISHDIIVKQHGGSIEVDTNPGDFTEFRIVLPRTAVGQQ